MEWELLAGLTDVDRQALLAAARRRRFAAREVVFHEGDPGDTFHLIAKGRLGVSQATPLGDRALLAILGPGEAFGELALLIADNIRTASITALEPSETLSIHRDLFEDLRRNHPQVDRLLVAALSRQVARLSQQVTELAFYSLDQRVLRRIVDLAEFYGADDGQAVIPLTQMDIAGLVGGTRPRVNEVLRKAEESGWLELRRGAIGILDLDGIRAKAR